MSLDALRQFAINYYSLRCYCCCCMRLHFLLRCYERCLRLLLRNGLRFDFGCCCCCCCMRMPMTSSSSKRWRSMQRWIWSSWWLIGCCCFRFEVKTITEWLPLGSIVIYTVAPNSHVHAQYSIDSRFRHADKVLAIWFHTFYTCDIGFF